MKMLTIDGQSSFGNRTRSFIDSPSSCDAGQAGLAPAGSIKVFPHRKVIIPFKKVPIAFLSIFNCIGRAVATARAYARSRFIISALK